MELELVEVALAGGGDGPLVFNATFLMQLFNFAILLIFLRLVVWKPLMKVIDQRKESISAEITGAETSRKEADDLRDQLKADFAKAKEDAREIIQKATKTAEDEAAQITETSKTEAKHIKDRAMQDIQVERDKAIAELRNEVAELSILVASKVVSEKMTGDLQEDLVERFVDEAGKLPC